MHLHFGAIHLVLTFYDRKDLSVVACIALLDTRFLNYQHAFIERVETTLTFPELQHSSFKPSSTYYFEGPVTNYWSFTDSNSIRANLYYYMV